jgi:hypothetical protein
MDSTDDAWYVSSSSAVSSLHLWTSYGWHCLWTSGAATGLPSWMMLTSKDDTYRLWFGVGDTVQTSILPIDFANARALIESGTGSFAESAYLETGLFDAGLTSYTKIANAVLLRTVNTSATNTISVSYRTSGDAGWTLLGTATAPGETLLPFGPLVNGVREGISFKEIEFRFEWTRDPDDTTTAPMLSSVVFSYLKTIPAYHSFSLRLTMQAPYAGRNPQEMQAKIDELISGYRFFTMQYRDTTKRVRIAQGGGNDIIGRGDYRSDRVINVVEVPEGL